MSLARIIGLVMLIVGIVLLVLGINATQHLSEEVVNAVSGKYTDQTTWYIIGGAALIVIGFALTFKRK